MKSMDEYRLASTKLAILMQDKAIAIEQGQTLGNNDVADLIMVVSQVMTDYMDLEVMHPGYDHTQSEECEEASLILEQKCDILETLVRANSRKVKDLIRRGQNELS